MLLIVGRSDEPFPAGVEIYAVVEALEPIEEELLDADLRIICDGWSMESAAHGPLRTLKRLDPFIAFQLRPNRCDRFRVVINPATGPLPPGTAAAAIRYRWWFRPSCSSSF